MDDTPAPTVKPQGWMKIPPKARALWADVITAAAAIACIYAALASSDLEGLWLRRPALIAEVLVLGAAWFFWRKRPERTPRAARHGLFLAAGVLGMLCMTFHHAGGENTLAGFLGLLAAMGLRGSYHDPEAAAELSMRAMASGGLRDPVTVVRDNIESLALSLVVVVLVWHFVLEAFRIPTGSMLPTLYGDEVWGDRVLVDKVVYDYRDPIRWEPTVFRYPLKRTDPYVKRVIGVPGEQVMIAQGDIYARKSPDAEIEILKKTKSARGVLWYPVVGAVKEKTEFLKWFARDGDPDFSEGAIKLRKGERVTFPKGAEGKPGDVKDHDPDGHGGLTEMSYNVRVVGDLRARFEVVSLADAPLAITLIRDNDEYALTVAKEAAQCSLKHTQGSGTSDLAANKWRELAADTGDEFEFSLADGQLEVLRNGTLIVSLDVGTALLDTLRNNDKSRLAAGKARQTLTSPEITQLASEAPRRGRIAFAADGDARLKLLGVDRDIYYVGRILDTEKGGKSDSRELAYAFTLREDEYFVLGDNSPGSKDTRFWIALDIVMNDGTVHTGGLDDGGQMTAVLLQSVPSGEPLTFRDAQGKAAPVSCLRSLQRLSRFSHEERGKHLPGDAEILKNSLEGLKKAAKREGHSKIQFILEGGGQAVINVDEIKELRVRPITSVKRELFVGKPFAVFLWPHRMKLIE